MRARRWLAMTDLLSANNVNWISALGKQASSLGGMRMLSNVKCRLPLVGGFHIMAFSPEGKLNLPPSMVTLLAGIVPFFWNASTTRFCARTRWYLFGSVTTRAEREGK